MRVARPSAKKEIPEKIRPFAALGFHYASEKVSGHESYGDCIFCGSRDKLYINTETGQWKCMAGKCQLTGNFYTFLKQWYEECKEGTESIAEKKAWEALEKDRGIPQDVLRREGVVYDGSSWYVPLRNATGAIVNVRRYTKGKGLMGLPTLDISIFGMEILSDDKNRGNTVFICEGEWDAIAMRMMLDESGVSGIVIGVPGAGIWKDAWTEYFIGRPIVICYDNDAAGQKGLSRVWNKLKGRCTKLECVLWPEELPPGFDVRDFVTKGGTWNEFLSLVGTYVTDEQKNEEVQAAETPKGDLRKRPSFEEVIDTFGQHLHMTDDMVTALRVIFATVLSQQIPGDPLWVHIVSPPGTAKTELLLPLAGCPSCYFASTLTPHSLVSGFATQGGGDPSLLPKLNGKTFVLKDYTEILHMAKHQKDEIYATLRGAYDGEVQKPFGNGLVREYKIRFNMLSGVTHSVFGERSASLGERFLIFHLVKGVEFHGEDSIRAAIRNVGKENTVRHNLQEVVQKFVEVKVTVDDLPEFSEKIEDRIIALSQLVAMLRANVEKAFGPGGQERVLFRPQHEVGTRLGKQLTKLAYGLSLVNSPPSLGEDEYTIVSRVALDTCIGYNLEAVAYMVSNGEQYIDQIATNLEIPITTLRDQLEDMYMLGILSKKRTENPHGRGAPRYLYGASPVVKELWKKAGLLTDPEIEALPEKRHITRSVRRVRHTKAE